jgi:hypothetical protein
MARVRETEARYLQDKSDFLTRFTRDQDRRPDLAGSGMAMVITRTRR